MARPKSPLKILQVATADAGGGATRVAWDLFQAYRRAGFCSWLAVGYKRSNDPDILEISNNRWRGRWANFWMLDHRLWQALQGKIPGIGLMRNLLAAIAEPKRAMNRYRGFEDFDFAGTHQLLELPPQSPDILHCHNLHGDYFDLRELPLISQRLPVVLTLHDAWLLSGHCAHSFDCERWKTGCGECPDLKIYPAIRKDATSYNWKIKQRILKESRLYVATPSRWLMQKVEQSMLMPAIIESRVIPNGLDLSVFHPADKRSARTSLGIPEKANVILFAASSIRHNIWKDYQTMRRAVAQISELLAGQQVLFIGLGEKAKTERIGQAEACFVPFQNEPSVVARYYQAADVYLHAARVDTFPTTVLEALACGTPVVATAVSGIPEQIDDGLTGFLVPPANSTAMAERVVQLLEDDNLRSAFSHRAADCARRNFDLNRQANVYLTWYNNILERWHCK